MRSCILALDWNQIQRPSHGHNEFTAALVLCIAMCFIFLKFYCFNILCLWCWWQSTWPINQSVNLSICFRSQGSVSVKKICYVIFGLSIGFSFLQLTCVVAVAESFIFVNISSIISLRKLLFYCTMVLYSAYVIIANYCRLCMLVVNTSCGHRYCPAVSLLML